VVGHNIAISESHATHLPVIKSVILLVCLGLLIFFQRKFRYDYVYGAARTFIQFGLIIFRIKT